MRMTSGRRELEASSVRRVRMRGNGFGGSAVESGIGIEKPKTYGKSRAEVMPFAFLSDKDGEEGRGGRRRTPRVTSRFPLAGFQRDVTG